jgi:hypothetical protein
MLGFMSTQQMGFGKSRQSIDFAAAKSTSHPGQSVQLITESILIGTGRDGQPTIGKLFQENLPQSLVLTYNIFRQPIEVIAHVRRFLCIKKHPMPKHRVF